MKKNITQAIILAAGMGVRLKELNRGVPKGFISLGDDKPIIEHSIDVLLDCGIKDIIIVTGFMDEHYENLRSRYPQIRTVRNEKYSETGTMYSLWCARKLFSTDFILLESDLIYEIRAIKELLQSPIKNSILMKNCFVTSKIKIKNSILASNSKITLDENNEEKTFLLGEGTVLSL